MGSARRNQQEESGRNEPPGLFNAVVNGNVRQLFQRFTAILQCSHFRQKQVRQSQSGRQGEQGNETSPELAPSADDMRLSDRRVVAALGL